MTGWRDIPEIMNGQMGPRPQMGLLERLLRVSRGISSLTMVVYESAAQRDRLIEEMREKDDAILVVSLPRRTVDLSEVVRARVGGSAFSALFVVGLEGPISSSEYSSILFSNLDVTRAIWADLLACPVVLWVSEQCFASLEAGARDFCAWVSHIIGLSQHPELAAASVAAGDRVRPLDKWASLCIGLIAFGFLAIVFFCVPGRLPRHKHRILALISAVLAGSWGYFMTGSAVDLAFEKRMSRFGKVTLQATGGAALFLLVLYWWSSDFGPALPR